MESMPSFPSFDYETDKANAGSRWEKWLKRLENFFVAMNIDNDDRKKALLLHYAGEQVYDIHEAECDPDANQTYATCKTVLNDYFKPKKNVQIEIYNFRSCIQKPGQTLDD